MKFMRALIVGTAAMLLVTRAIGGELFVLSDGSTIALYELSDGSLTKKLDVIASSAWASPVWPSWNSTRGTLIFAGIHKEAGYKAWIYEAHLSRPQAGVTGLLAGRLPSTSPNGRHLAFVAESRLLNVMDLTTGVVTLVAENFGGQQPAVWLNDEELAFISVDQRLTRVDVHTRASSMLAEARIHPVAVDRREERLLGLNPEGSQLTVLDMRTFEQTTLHAFRLLRIAYAAVLTHSGDAFLYARQTWPHVLMMSEAADLFLSDFSGREVRVAAKMTLFGGVALDTETGGRISHWTLANASRVKAAVPPAALPSDTNRN